MATREDSSESMDEELEASPEVSQEEAPGAPRIVTSLIPLFDIPPKVSIVSFGTFDDAGVWDSVSSIVPK